MRKLLVVSRTLSKQKLYMFTYQNARRSYTTCIKLQKKYIITLWLLKMDIFRLRFDEQYQYDYYTFYYKKKLI